MTVVPASASGRSTHLTAILQALFVTFLWSTSWVLIKFGLQDIPPLTFAGLRYSLAFLCLFPFAWRSYCHHPVRPTAQEWRHLVVLGFLFYAVTQGAQFVGLAYLPAVTVNLLLNFTTLVVTVLSIYFLAERPTLFQWGGAALFLLGVLSYFYPVTIPAGQAIGFVVVLFGVLANALSAILGRSLNRQRRLPPLTVTVISMGIGAFLLLCVGLLRQGLPRLSLLSWAVILWLAVVNTALAFTLWNHTLRTLTAVQSSILNNTMLIQIALLAWLFLGERPTGRAIVGLALATAGALIVQLRPRP